MKRLLCIFGIHKWEYSIDPNYKGIDKCIVCKDDYGKVRVCKHCGHKEIKFHFYNECCWINLIK